MNSGDQLASLEGFIVSVDLLITNLRLLQRHITYGVTTSEELTELHRCWMRVAFLAEILRLDDSRLEMQAVARAAAEAYVERNQLVFNTGPFGQS